MIQLKRPLVFLDVETTGVWPERDRIIDIALIRVQPDGAEEVFQSRVDPEMAIPPASTAIHHITDADVQGAPTFRMLAAELARWLTGADLSGFGVRRLDLLMLTKEFGRAGVPFDPSAHFIVDVQGIFHLKEPRNLSAAHQFYLARPLVGAHSALADARACFEIFSAQLGRYPDLPQDVPSLHRLTKLDAWVYVDENQRFRWWNGEAHFNFGKAEVYGRSLREIAATNPGYLEWMLTRDFSAEVQAIVADALRGKFPREGERS